MYPHVSSLVCGGAGPASTQRNKGWILWYSRERRPTGAGCWTRTRDGTLSCKDARAAYDTHQRQGMNVGFVHPVTQQTLKKKPNMLTPTSTQQHGTNQSGPSSKRISMLHQQPVRPAPGSALLLNLNPVLLLNSHAVECRFEHPFQVRCRLTSSCCQAADERSVNVSLTGCSNIIH